MTVSRAQLTELLDRWRHEIDSEPFGRDRELCVAVRQWAEEVRLPGAGVGWCDRSDVPE
jgi:hypothetical protein